MRCRMVLCLALATLIVCSTASTAAAQSKSGASESESASATSSGSETEGETESDEGDSSEPPAKTEGGDESKTSEKRESEHGSYEWRRSYGGGIEYGLFFAGLDRWNTHLLEPSNAPTFDTTALSSFTFAIEASLLEGSRLTAFGGLETPFSDNPEIMAVYGGLEPAFAFRRNFWELALGFGVGVGSINASTGDDRTYGAGLVVMRPTIEVRRYFNELIAGYARFGFNQWLPFNGSPDGLQVQRSDEQVSRESLLQEGGVYAALGVRFGHYPRHRKVVPDSDGDGIRDDVDDCKNEPEDEDGFEDHDGCPDQDNDGDGVSDADDECPEAKEDQDGFEDDDGCPDEDNDGDGIADDEDECPDEAEDEDGFEDDDGCPDPDNDGDGTADADDECPGEVGIPSNDGCPSEKVRIEGDRLVVDGAIEFRAAGGGDSGDSGAEDEEGDGDENKSRTELTSDSKKLLDVVAEVLSVHPELAEIEIQAHTAKGDEKKMKQESQKRAEAVRDYLVDAGVDSGRLTAKGYGASKPTEPEGGGEKKPLARVEFHITKRAAPEKSGENKGESKSESK